MEGERKYENIMVQCKEAVTPLEKNPCYEIPTKMKKISASENRHQINNKPAWVYTVSLILVGCAAFISVTISSWTMTQVSSRISKLEMEMKLQAFNISEKIINFQSVINNCTSELERRVTQLQNSHYELQSNVSRSLDSELNIIIQLLTGQYSNLPADSCSHILLLNSFSPSDQYWIRSSNGSAVHVYCDFNRQCGCDGPSTWTRVAFLNMSDPNQVCPSNWTTISSPVRTCGRGRYSSRGCNSVFYSTFGMTYSRVCGRIMGYQDASTDGLQGLVQGNIRIDGPYIDGVSLTHGPVGSRQHIWSFASAVGENTQYHAIVVCGCSNDNNWPYSTSFVGNDYFCDSGNHGTHHDVTFFSDDPLWNGQGCGPSSTCCQFNDPPWFCKILPQSTTDDLEVRICYNSRGGIYDEDIPLQLVELYVQ